MTEQPLWQPSDAQHANAQITAFRQWVNQREGIELADYPSLWQWSLDQPAAFWQGIWDYCGILASQPHTQVVDDPHKMPGARWFSGARLNFAENLLRHCADPAFAKREAAVFRNESGDREAITYPELGEQVARLAQVLRQRGVGIGDRVAAFMPNRIETLVAMLATASLGAIWSSCSPDFGLHGVVDRFGQIEPKVLFAIDGYVYAGKRIDTRDRVQAIAQALSSLASLIVVPYLQSDPDISALPNAELYTDIMAHSTAEPATFEPLPFDHPLYVLYSSGTTGVPKCIVHSAGGTLIQHLKEHRLHTDLREGDRFFYFTTCGWMMWNWLVTGLASGATLILFDGSPFHPEPTVLMDLAEQEQVAIFGTSAKYIAALEKAGVKPAQSHDLSALRAVLSTGSPLAHEGFDYVYRDIKADLCLSSISGGTDIVSCFALGNPVLPVYRGELQCAGLGMAVNIFNEQGEPITQEKGELVCTQAFPSCPIGFWNDPEQRRFHEAYFARFPGIWAHGDYGEITAHGGIIIYGRSDAVLNPGGVRIGTAEIYRQVEKIDAVLESLAVGQDWDNDVRVILFVRLKPGHTLDDELITIIKTRIRQETTPRHVPAKVIAVNDIPRTLSGKIVELAVRKVIHGETVKNTDALANPEALELFRGLPELQS